MAKKKAAKGAKGRAAEPSPRAQAKAERKDMRQAAISGAVGSERVKKGGGVMAAYFPGNRGRVRTVYHKGGKVYRKSRKGGFVEGAGGDE